MMNFMNRYNPALICSLIVYLSTLVGVCSFALSESPIPERLPARLPARILTKSGQIPLNVTVSKTPESWTNISSAGENVSDNLGVMFLYPRSRICAYSAAGSSRTFDILLIAVSGQISGIIDEMKSDGWYARPAACIAAVILPGGFCAKNRIAPGHAFAMENQESIFKSREEMHSDELPLVVKKLRENISAEPSNTKWIEQLALFHLGINQSGHALPLIEKLLTQKTTSKWLDLKGRALAAQQNLSEAELAFRAAIESDPENYNPQAALAMLLTQSDRSAEAVDLLSKYILERPEAATPRIDLAAIFLDTDRTQDAVQALKDGLIAIGSDADLLHAYGEALVRAGDYAEAAEAFESYLTACPFDTNTHDLKVFITIHKYRKKLVSNDKQ